MASYHSLSRMIALQTASLLCSFTLAVSPFRAFSGIKDIIFLVSLPHHTVCPEK